MRRSVLRRPSDMQVSYHEGMRMMLRDGANGYGHNGLLREVHPKLPAFRPLPGHPSRCCHVLRLCGDRSEEHTSELQSLMRTSYAGFLLKKKIYNKQNLT